MRDSQCGPEQDPILQVEQICEEVFSQHSDVILKEIRRRVKKEVSSPVAVRMPRIKAGGRSYSARSGPLALGPGKVDPATMHHIVVACIADIRYPRNNS